MKKFLTGILTITLLSTLYVFQQTKLLEYSYNIDSRQKALSLLIDRNNELRYNIAKLERPARLQDFMLAREDSAIYLPPAQNKIRSGPVKFADSHNLYSSTASFSNLGKIISSMFLLDKEAIAKELSR